MITTTLAVLALAGGLGSGVIPSTPNHYTDYAQAMNRAAAEGKPMAVFIGRGADSFQKLVTGGSISFESARLLSNTYVCTVIDADSAAGKDLASRFEIAEGLVISSPGGNLQAYRHSGAVSSTDLAKNLTRFAVAAQPATTVNGGVITTRGGYYIVPASGYSYPTYGTVCLPGGG